MTIKELEDVLRCYDNDLVISFNIWDAASDSIITEFDAKIQKNNYNNILEITVG